MKKIIATGSSIAILLAMAAPAFAFDGAVNYRTGYQSVNNVSVNRTVTARTANVNLTGVGNLVFNTQNTGGVAVNGNTGGGNQGGSGNATERTTLTNNLDQTNVTIVKSCSKCSGGLAGNAITGAQSVNNASVNTNTEVSTLNVNAVLVVNAVASHTDTGGVSVSGNTGGGNIGVSGDASTTTTITNTLNQGSTTIVH